MRMLSKQELALVSGATSELPPPIDESCGKNNNGYGNGAESGPAPGNSGAHNPQLWTANSGPRGDR
jgi:hypothetical protein